jgi:hypothetical protein
MMSTSARVKSNGQWYWRLSECLLLMFQKWACLFTTITTGTGMGVMSRFMWFIGPFFGGRVSFVLDIIMLLVFVVVVLSRG